MLSNYLFHLPLADISLGSPEAFIQSFKDYVMPSAIGFATALATVRAINSILRR